MKIFAPLIYIALMMAFAPAAFAQSLTDTTRAPSISAEHALIDRQYLALAKQNIEKYRKGDASLLFTDGAGKPLKNVRLTINQTSQDFLFGNLSEEAFNPAMSPVQAERFKTMFKDLFNFTELIVKWTGYERQQGKPDWRRLQDRLDWCKQNNITPKGHNLGWTNMSGTPPWLLKLPVAQATQLYRSRIYNLVSGFKDQMNMWDVVNEPVTTIPWEKALKDSIFGESKIDDGSRYNTKGVTLPEIVPWVENSYKWAYEANPKGDFILNEFYLIAKPEMREKFYELVKELQRRNTPVTGIGIQGHEPREMWFPTPEIIKTFDRLNELGLPLHITELIPQSSGKKITGGWREGIWSEEAQAEFAEQFYTLAFGYPSMASIHWWGLSDRFIWLKGGGLIDADMNPKPVYTRLKKLIKEDWMTKNVNVKTDKEGHAAFRGFFGEYSIDAIYPSGVMRTFKLRIQQQGQKEFNLK